MTDNPTGYQHLKSQEGNRSLGEDQEVSPGTKIDYPVKGGLFLEREAVNSQGDSASKKKIVL